MTRARSHIFSQARGKVGDVVYTANAFAPLLIRAHVVPAQPPSVYRDAAQATFLSLRSSWSALSDSNRLKWEAYGSHIISLSSLITHPLGGWHAFQLSNFTCQYTRRLGIHGTPDSFIPPLSIGLLAFLYPATVYQGGALQRIRLTIFNPNLEDIRPYGYATLPQSSARLTWHGPYDPTTWSRGASVLPQTTGFYYIPGILPGNTYFWRVRLISTFGPRRVSRWITGRIAT